jgi:hypothetical protein
MAALVDCNHPGDGRPGPVAGVSVAAGPSASEWTTRVNRRSFFASARSAIVDR